MNHLNLFNSLEEYNYNKSELGYPAVSLISEQGGVCFKI